MTAQINDTCFHKKLRYELSGISGSGLFEPSDLGLEPVSTSTACWRGYVARYSILGEELFLTELNIGLRQHDPARARGGGGPELFGVLPRPGQAPYFGFHYDGFRSSVAFTGGLLLAREIVGGLAVNMGFQKPWKYRYVREITFLDGHVIDDIDRSSELAAVRAKITEEMMRAGARPGRPPDADTGAWIERCFSRDYSRRGEGGDPESFV